MIRAHFGIVDNPFGTENITLLDHQQDIYDTIKVHSHQGGFCLLIGEPGTGKTVIKEAIKSNADKRMLVVPISRTMHTYSNIIHILCEAFAVEATGHHYKCEKLLIDEAYALNRVGKAVITIIDEAHLIEMDALRKLRLLFGEFPKNHNLILIGQPEILSKMSLRVNDDIKSRITYSTTLFKLNHEDIENFILKQLDRVSLGHNTFTAEALSLIARSADGVIRKARNLALSAMLEAVRAQKKTIDIELVNRVLIQPHWRNDIDFEER